MKEQTSRLWQNLKSTFLTVTFGLSGDAVAQRRVQLEGKHKKIELKESQLFLVKQGWKTGVNTTLLSHIST